MFSSSSGLVSTSVIPFLLNNFWISLIRIARRFGNRSAQAKALTSDHNILQEGSGDSDAYDDTSDGNDQSFEHGSGDSLPLSHQNLYKARRKDHVQLQEADDFD